MDITKGASNSERLLAACRNDQDDMLTEILQTNDYDINYRDGIGETALHYAAKSGSVACLDLLLKVPGIQLNLGDYIENETPLFKAVKYREDANVALAMAEALLEAGADPRAKNREGMTPAMVVSEQDQDMYDLLNRSTTTLEIDDSDIAYDEDVDAKDVPSSD